MPRLHVLQPCDARAVEAADLAEAIGGEAVRKLAHGEGAGAYEVRLANASLTDGFVGSRSRVAG